MKINQIVVEVFNNKETGTTHKGGVVTKTSHGIKHTKNDYDDGHGVQGAKSSGKESKYKQTPILDKDDDLDEGVAEARDGDTNFGSTVGNGSWVVYDGSKVKRFKSRDGAKAYAEKNGGKVASSEHYADNIQKQEVDEGETWSKHNNPRAGGMSKKSVSSYRRSHPGSKIQTAVTTKPSKLKKGSKAAKRRKSFCARMRGMKKHRTGAKTARDPNSNINKSLRRWNCESVEQMRELVMLAEQFIAKHKK
jgi:hypothetical protein